MYLSELETVIAMDMAVRFARTVTGTAAPLAIALPSEVMVSRMWVVHIEAPQEVVALAGVGSVVEKNG